jgi:predicted unusual protein kinase regulating ubiquinone biosynthesis (AarF/ABC1/UbiB family)
VRHTAPIGLKQSFTFSWIAAYTFRSEVAKLISSVFNAQIFENGFVHVDPHEANVLLREHPLKKGKPQLVLVDHGLYKRLDEEFQEAYAWLWKSIVMADIPNIQAACRQLGVDKMVSKSLLFEKMWFLLFLTIGCGSLSTHYWRQC